MNVAISGQAGLALLFEGKQLHSMHRDRPGELVPRRDSSLRLLLSDVRDLEIFENVDKKRAEAELALASARSDALHLALILLDSSLPDDIRDDAAAELEELLADQRVASYVEGVLWSHPLPGDGDLSGAKRLAALTAPRALQLLADFEKNQSNIALAWAAWQEIPDRLFKDAEERNLARALAVRRGLFRYLAASLSRKRSLEELLSGLLGRQETRELPNSRQVCAAWVTPLRKRGPAGAPLRRVPEAAGAVAEMESQRVVGSLALAPRHDEAQENPVNALVAAIQEGRRIGESSGRLFDLFRPRVFHFFAKKGFTVEESRDLTQESFVRVFTGIATYRGAITFDQWLFDIATNVYRKEIRQRHAEKRDGFEESLEAERSGDAAEEGAGSTTPLVASAPSPFEMLAAREERARLRAALQKLPPNMRACCRLRYEQSLKYEEIARVMGISIETVKAHLHQAKKRLTQALRPEAGRNRDKE